MDITRFRHTSHRPDTFTIELRVRDFDPRISCFNAADHGLEDGAYLSKTMGKSLGKVEVGKASIGFKDADAIDLDALIALVSREREIGI